MVVVGTNALPVILGEGSGGHKRYKKSRERLASLKGMVPLARADAAKLKKLGFKKTWWTSIKS